MNTKTLYLMCGLPGSGKSIYAKNLAAKEHIDYVSRDEIRFSLIGDSADYFCNETQVFREFIDNIRYSLNHYGICIADATHISKKSRAKIINALKIKDLCIKIIFMNTPIDICIRRNRQRDGLARVPDAAIYKMHNSLEIPIVEESPYIKDIIVIDPYTIIGENFE